MDSRKLIYRYVVKLCCILLVILSVSAYSGYNKNIKEKDRVVSSEIKSQPKHINYDNYKSLLKNLFDYRNQAILKRDEKSIKSIFDTSKKFGLWAYEHEIKKMNYLENWSNKQGVKFNNIKTNVNIIKVSKKEKNLFGIICNVSTEYNYSYLNQTDRENIFKIGTQHYLNVRLVDKRYIITKEWYTDPFEDSLTLDNIKSDDIKKYITSQNAIKLSLTPEQKKGVDYAHTYSGTSEESTYNKNYNDFNPQGGDCANFASQIMFESTRFKKNPQWNYDGRDGTNAWVNAQAFKNYMIYSGRGSLIARGSYEEVYKDAYQLRPGDFVGYEKKSKITHISTITGIDSKGYPLVTCHNTDRLLVPWDLGWSDKDIKFHLIKINY